MEISKVHDISILHLFGEVSFMEMARIERTLDSLSDTRARKVLIDMSSVDYIHYVIIKKLILRAMRFRGENGDIKLVRPSREVKEVMRFVGADQCFEDYASISEAILSFLRQGDVRAGDYQ